MWLWLREEWIDSGMRTVVLGADEKQWAKLKASTIELFIVQDAGLTEIEAGSETVMSTYPIRKDEAPKEIKRLQAYKDPFGRLWDLCKAFIHKHHIYSGESVYQSDSVSLDSLDLIESICKLVGYHVYSDEDNKDI